MSNYLENALINATLRNVTYTSPATVYVGLFTSDPTDAGTGTEVAGNAYARQAAVFAAPSNGASSISTAIEFPQATGTWGTVTHIGIYDTSSAGNLLYHNSLTTSKTIEIGDVFSMAISNLTVTLA